MRRFAITLMVVTMAFTAAAQALSPTSAVGGYGMSSSVTYKKLLGGTWEYAYDIFAEGDNNYYDYFMAKFEFNNGGDTVDHVLNLYDPGTGPELREYWTVNGMLGNRGGDWFWGGIETGVQASYGDLATNTWFTDPTAAQATAERWFIDPVYAAAEGMANPFHDPLDYARWAGNSYYTGEGDAAYGLYAGKPIEWAGDGSANELHFDMTWFRGGHMYGGYSGPQLMATIRIVSDLAPYGATSFQFYSSGTSGIGAIMGPGTPTAGDFDGDEDIDEIDIDLLADAIRTGSVNFALFDISADGTTDGTDGVIDRLDLDYLVRFLVETSMGLGSEYGDFNLDGLVDVTDLTRLATFFGLGSIWAEGNANRDLDLLIDTTDLTILATFFGFDASVDVIPEPATMTLLALGGLAALRRRRR